MNEAVAMTEEKAFKEDVKKMSHDDLMAAIRYLDDERQRIAENVHNNAKLDNIEEKILKHAA